MNKYIALLTTFLFFGCAELQQIANQYPQLNTIGNADIAMGLKEALNNGISKQVSKLTSTDGFF
jgi:hypothetical protein